jgi:glycerophosphoryl diester phosphodiesterase
LRSCFIAHRGESFDAPENTLGAINLAWELGIAAVEIDIHLTADNEICVIHDYDTLRITGVKRIVRNSTMDELRALDAGSFKGSEWKNERIPTLGEVLKTVPPKGKLVVEIKSDSRIIPRLQQEILESKLRSDQIEIIAFNFYTLAKAKNLMPNITMLWLFVLQPRWIQYLVERSPQAIVQKLKNSNINGVNIGISKYLTSKLIAEYKAANLLVYSWTIDDPKRAKKLLENGVDCITSNRPSWVVEELSKH